jgi:CNT family concentrative nucleoside transporter
MSPEAAAIEAVPLAQRLVGFIGIATIIAIAWTMSENRRAVSWRLVAMALLLQAGFAVLILKTVAGIALFAHVGRLVDALISYNEVGARFVFGNLAQSRVPVGAERPDGTLDTTLGLTAETGAYFAFNVLPTIIFLSALMSVLYHLGVMQPVIRGMAWVMQRTLRTSGAETLSASANIFLGQTESPLVVRPFIARMTPSELFNVMVCGFATAAGSVLAAYTLMLRDVIPDVAGHLLAATILQTPAAILLAKVIVPETRVPETAGSMPLHVEHPDNNVLEAAASGAAQGVTLALNVAAMLMAFIALIALLNAIVGQAGATVGLPDLSLQAILGTLLRPLAWVMGVPWVDTAYVGSLLGMKTVLNEFVAFGQLATDLRAGVPELHVRSRVIASYAVVGFANLSSIAIQIGGIGGMAPERRGDIARHGLKAMIAGNLAAFMSACWAGILL